MEYELTVVSSSYLTSRGFPHQLYYSRKKVNLGRSSTTIVVLRDVVFGKTANTRTFPTPPLTHQSLAIRLTTRETTSKVHVVCESRSRLARAGPENLGIGESQSRPSRPQGGNRDVVP
jgi:hypothetical protein